MFNDHALADCAGAILIEKAERRLDALLAEHGVSDPKELPPATAFEIFQRAVIETAAATFPAANVEMLKHNCRSFGHSAFLTAMERMRVSCKSPGDAFEMTRGVHAAVVLAGYGLLVAPFDLDAMRILTTPSKDIDTVLELFSRDKGVYVGYSSCKAPFYLLLTDCVRTLRRLVLDHPRFSQVKNCSRAPTSLCHRIPSRASCTDWPSPPASRGTPFRPWGCSILTRRRGRSRCMPVGRWTANAMEHPMRDMSPSRGSCFARLSMTRGWPTVFGATPSSLPRFFIERALVRRGSPGEELAQDWILVRDGWVDASEKAGGCRRAAAFI